MIIINWENQKIKSAKVHEINLDFISENRIPDYHE